MKIKKVALGLLTLLLAACFGKDPEIGQTLTGERIQVIGHGGSGFDSIDNYFPANAKKSILQGVDILGADGVEVDVQLTKDSVLVLYHDNRLETQTDCVACISDHTWEDIMACRFRSNIALNFDTQERLWLLDSLLANFAAKPRPPWINIDISMPVECDSDFGAGEYFRTLARQLSKLIHQYNAASWVYVEWTGLDDLDYLQELHPELNLVWLGRVDQEILNTLAARGFWGVVTPNADINKSQVEEAHRMGLGVILYNVKIRQGALEAVEKGPDLIETDNIPLLQAVLE